MVAEHLNQQVFGVQLFKNTEKNGFKWKTDNALITTLE